jgi:hypothetical protein
MKITLPSRSYIDELKWEQSVVFSWSGFVCWSDGVGWDEEVDELSLAVLLSREFWGVLSGVD